jgi:hypothetical protein
MISMFLNGGVISLVNPHQFLVRSSSHPFLIITFDFYCPILIVSAVIF